MDDFPAPVAAIPAPEASRPASRGQTVTVPASAATFLVAVDTGGTFTDAACVTADGRLVMAKVPTSLDDPAAGVLAALGQLAVNLGMELPELLAGTTRLLHGTTLGLNALLEGRGARVALLCTEGFRDALELRRSRLPDQWDFRAPLPPLLVPRYLRLGIRERVDYSGRVLTPLDEAQVRRAAAHLAREPVEAVAVCFLFSFKNSVHERRAAEILRESLPGLFVVASSEVAPRLGEYERTVTAVLNAYLGPVTAKYLERLAGLLRERSWNGRLEVMTNSGGLTDDWGAAGAPARSLISGPAGGALGAATFARAAGRPHLVLADMGGTSFDLHVVEAGQGELVPEGEIAGYPLALAQLDIQAIGAGGGSIAWADAGGRLRVGPASAGSWPGPACYGRGGEQPTVTDACLLLGMLPEEGLLAGNLRLRADAAAAALEDRVAAPLGLDVLEAAAAVYEVAAGNMADALRLVTLGRGRDPRDLGLLSAGGSFPLFAARVARELRLADVLIPLQGPIFCAWGMLGAGRRCDLVRSLAAAPGAFQPESIGEALNELQAEAERELDRLDVESERRKFEVALEMRYVGQHHQITVPLPSDPFEGGFKGLLERAFQARHERLYGYSLPGRPWEAVELRLAAEEIVCLSELLPPPDHPEAAPGIPSGREGKRRATAEQEAVEKRFRSVFLNPLQPWRAEVLSVSSLARRATASLCGPLLLELPYSTVLVPPGFAVGHDPRGFLRLTEVSLS